MQSSPHRRASCFLLALAALFSSVRLAAAAEDRSISLADGSLKLTAPETWERKKPQNNVIQYEFAVAPAGDDANAGRVTISGAGGSIDANIDRWIGQFVQPDGSSTKKVAKVDRKKIAGQEVHFVDLSGTFKDQPGGPFSGGPVVERKGYRMLAAIIVTKDLGNYFIKFYGPERTVGDNKAPFDKMIESLEVK
jgi:hypothetical protein